MRLIGIALGLMALLGCTENSRARSFGGEMTIAVPCNMRVFDVTWKETDFWYAYQPMPEEYEPVQSVFASKPNEVLFSRQSGHIYLNESRCP